MFIARQPIFNRALKIYGYELLFRSNEQSNAFSNATSTSATAVVLGGLFEQGIDKIVGKAKAFVNFDYAFLMSDMIELIDPKTLVIEILETVIYDEALFARIQELRNKGYKIALDDFEEDYFDSPTVEMADIIKYDIIATPLDTIQVDVQEALKQNHILLAEKIETEEEYQKARTMGFQLFQGYFFSKPKIVPTAYKAKKSPKTVYVQILNELRREDFSYDRITRIIETDVNLSYRLLYINSRKKENKFSSIRHALIRMGRYEIERWINVVMLQNLAADKPDEVIRLSLLRSRFGEFVAEHSAFKQRKDEVSLMCLFSMLDVVLDSSMEEALRGLAISEDISAALVNGTGAFMPLCMLLQSYENGDWSAVDEYAKSIQVNPENLTLGYYSAIEWASIIMDVYS